MHSEDHALSFLQQPGTGGKTGSFASAGKECVDCVVQYSSVCASVYYSAFFYSTSGGRQSKNLQFVGCRILHGIYSSKLLTDTLIYVSLCLLLNEYIFPKCKETSEPCLAS